MMKTFLLLSVSSVATAGALPSLPAKIILSAFVLMAVLTQAARRAPVGSACANVCTAARFCTFWALLPLYLHPSVRVPGG